MKKLIFSIYLKVKNICKSIGDFNNFHLGDEVIYEGNKGFIDSIEDTGEERFWTVIIYSLDYNTNPSCTVQESEIKKILSLKTIKNSFTFHYKTWRKYLYEVDLEYMLRYRKF